MLVSLFAVEGTLAVDGCDVGVPSGCTLLRFDASGAFERSWSFAYALDVSLAVAGTRPVVTGAFGERVQRLLGEQHEHAAVVVAHVPHRHRL